MSGTQEMDFLEQNSENILEEVQENALPGAKQDLEQEEKPMSASQKMDMLLRSSNPKSMKKEIEKLRKESSRYRNLSKSEAEQRALVEAKNLEIQQELEALRISHRSLKVMRALDKAGCIKSELVAKDIPSDCEDLESFIEEYKLQNGFLFKEKKDSYGGGFKPSVTKNLTPSQQMDAYIRAALGR